MKCDIQLHGNKSTCTGLKFSTSKILSVVMIRSRTVNPNVHLIKKKNQVKTILGSSPSK